MSPGPALDGTPGGWDDLPSPVSLTGVSGEESGLLDGWAITASYGLGRPTRHSHLVNVRMASVMRPGCSQWNAKTPLDTWFR